MAVPVSLPGVGSAVTALAAVAVSVIVIPPVLALTLTTTCSAAVSALATLLFAKTIFPVPPATTASDRDQPAGKEAETKVVLAGTGFVTVTVCEASGPLLIRLI